MPTFLKPSGTLLKVNENSAPYCEELGFERVPEEGEKPKPKRRGRPPKKTHEEAAD